MKFSVVIPTLRRSDTLHHTLSTVVSQGFSDLEVVVQNNGNDSATNTVVREFADPRIRIFATDHVLPMTANWEQALTQASGDYVTFIGDDDALLPDACTTADLVLQNGNIDLLTWAPLAYYWPQYSHHENLRNRIVGQFSVYRGGRWLNSGTSLADFYRFRIHYSKLPMIYNSFVSRAVIDRVKKEIGTYFCGASPDVTSGILNAANSDQYFVLDFPLSVSGISHHSTGHNTVMSRRGTRSTDEIRQDFGETRFDSRLPPTHHHLDLALANDMLLVQDIALRRRTEIEFDFAGLARRLIANVNDRPDFYKDTIEAAMSLAKRYAIDLTDIPIPPPSARQTLKTGITMVAADRIRVVIDGDRIGLRNIEDAVALASQLLPSGSLSVASRIAAAPSPVTKSSPPPPLAAGDALFFAVNQTGLEALQNGWSRPESWGTWSVGKRADMRIRLPDKDSGSIGLQLRHRSHLSSRHPRVEIVCRISDRVIDHWACTEHRPAAVRNLNIPEDLVGPDREIALTFEISDPRSPADLGISSDRRNLGIGVEWIKRTGPTKRAWRLRRHDR